MVKSKDLSHCGIDEIFERINRDLTELCDGVQVVTANGERTIYRALMSVCGDTLAQHEVAGFKIGVGFAYSKCKTCRSNLRKICLLKGQWQVITGDVMTLKRQILTF